MNIKVVAVFLVCAFLAAEARPGKGGKEGGMGGDSENRRPPPPPPGAPGKADGKGRGSNETKPNLVNLTVEGLKKLCEGLSSGNITNTNSSYDTVFTSLGDVCADVATYLAAQAAPTPAPTPAPVQDPAAGTVRRKRGARPGGPKGPGGVHGGSHSADVDDESKPENKALDILFKICKGLQQVQANLPADLAADLVNIFTKMGAVCTAADLVRNPVAPAAPA